MQKTTIRDARNLCRVLGLNPANWKQFKLAIELTELIYNPKN